jgi:hypothetical protein
VANLKEILQDLNSKIKELNSIGYNIFDEQQQEYFMNTIRYDSDSDKLICVFKEDK